MPIDNIGFAFFLNDPGKCLAQGNGQNQSQQNNFGDYQFFEHIEPPGQISRFQTKSRIGRLYAYILTKAAPKIAFHKIMCFKRDTSDYFRQ
jgi:hypothetical protein